MRVFSAVALFVASAFAFTITDPTNQTIWGLTGSHTVSWTSVSTDRINFTIVLSNQQVNPSYTQALVALAVTSDGNTTVNPPASGWPTGHGFQINFVTDEMNLNSILAQSGQFTIEASSSGLTSSTTTKATSTFVVGNTGVLPSSTPSTTTKPSSASGGFAVHTGFIAAIALLGAALA